MFRKWWFKVKYRRMLFTSSGKDTLEILNLYVDLMRLYSLDQITYKQRLENSFLSITDTAGDFIRLSNMIHGQISRNVNNLTSLPSLRRKPNKTNFDVWLTTADGDISEKEFIEQFLPIIDKIVMCLLKNKSDDDVFYTYSKKALDLYFKTIITMFDILIRLEIGDTKDVPRHIRDLILRR